MCFLQIGSHHAYNISYSHACHCFSCVLLNVGPCYLFRNHIRYINSLCVSGYWSMHKPFQCTQCNAAFCRKPYLDIHMVRSILNFPSTHLRSAVTHASRSIRFFFLSANSHFCPSVPQWVDQTIVDSILIFLFII